MLGLVIEAVFRVSWWTLGLASTGVTGTYRYFFRRPLTVEEYIANKESELEERVSKLEQSAPRRHSF